MGVSEVLIFLADGRFSSPAAAQRVDAAAAFRFLYDVVLERHWLRGALEGTRLASRSRQKPAASALRLTMSG